MIVDIRGQGFSVTPALAEHVRRRLGFVLTCHSDRIQQVAVRVGDENGPRGEVDKYCRIQIHLTDVPVAVMRVVAKHLDRTHPVRDVARHGARPCHNRWQPLESDRAQGDTA